MRSTKPAITSGTALSAGTVTPASWTTTAVVNSNEVAKAKRPLAGVTIGTSCKVTLPWPALNLLARLNDLIFGPEPPGHLPRRRQAKFVRRMLLCVPARVIHHARRIILRLPAGLPSAPASQNPYSAARGLAPPAVA